MSTVVASTKIESFADVLRKLGDVPTSRIRSRPYPGTATEQDILAIHAKEGRLFELVDGILVEKAMGFKASWLAIVLGAYLLDFVRPRNLGLVAGEAGMLRLSSGLVRIPDVSYISWSRIPEGRIPEKPIPNLVPNLAVEVLIDSNTAAEMKRKRREYFKAGVSLIWIVDPEKRTVAVYTSIKKLKTLTESQTLDGGDVLAGFTLSLKDLFACLDQQAPK